MPSVFKLKYKNKAMDAASTDMNNIIYTVSVKNKLMAGDNISHHYIIPLSLFIFNKFHNYKLLFFFFIQK